MKIRKAKKKELKKVAKIYQNCFNEEPYNEGWSFDEAFRKMKVFSKYCEVWVFILDKKIVGFLVVNPHHWRIGEIAFGEEIGVMKKYRKKEIATKLLKFAFKYYKDKGYRKFMGFIDKGAKSHGFIKKLNLNLNKRGLIVWKKLK